VWPLLIALASAQDDGDVESLVLPEATLVVRGTATSANAGDRKRVWDLARQGDFNVMLPGAVLPVVCVRVHEVLYGDFMGDKACFYRASALSLATEDLTGTGDQVVGREAVWLLREADLGVPFLFARDREAFQPAAYAPTIKERVNNTGGRGSLASPAVPSRPVGVTRQGVLDLIAIHDLAAVEPLRAVLSFGTAAEKVAVIDAVAELGLLSMVDAVIDHVDDFDKVTTDLDPIGRPVGMFAAEALARMAPRLDGRVEKERPRDLFGFNPIDFELRAVAVEEEWKKWWADWKATGPVR
jgi:hypothetical protein